MDIPFHPMIVHFPIALLIICVVFEALGRILHQKHFHESGLWLLGLGLGTGVMAYLSGEQAEEAAEHAGIPESLIEMHEILALATLSIFAFLFLFRFFQRKNFSDQMLGVYFFVALIGIGSLAATGHYGGDLVYKHGAGVSVGVSSVISYDHEDHDD